MRSPCFDTASTLAIVRARFCGHQRNIEKCHGQDAARLRRQTPGPDGQGQEGQVLKDRPAWRTRPDHRCRHPPHGSPGRRPARRHRAVQEVTRGRREVDRTRPGRLSTRRQAGEEGSTQHHRSTTCKQRRRSLAASASRKTASSAPKPCTTPAIWVQERRARTRQLIELGGLVQKTGLTELLHDDRAALLGAMMELADQLRGGRDGVKERSPQQLAAAWRHRGLRAFEMDKEATAT